MNASLSPQTIAIVKATAPALEQHGLEITRRMYERLFENEDIKGMFDQAAQESGEQPKRLAAAIIGYSALTTRAIPQHRAQWDVALFFLSGVTAAIANLAEAGGPGLRCLYSLFPADLDMGQR